MPPISCTSKWRIFSVRWAASRHHRERLRQQLIEGSRPLSRACELLGSLAQRLVTELLDLRLELVGGAHGACVATDEPLIAAAETRVRS